MKVSFYNLGQTRQKTFYNGEQNTWTHWLVEQCGGRMPVFKVLDETWSDKPKRRFKKKDEDEIISQEILELV